MKNQKEQQRNTAIELNAGDRFTIPTGCKVTIEDNQIIIEEQKEEFKDGDILHSNITGRVVIFKNYENEIYKTFCTYYNSANTDNSHWVPTFFRHATQREKDSFFSKLYAQGLQWNAATKTMEKVRKRVEAGEDYLYISKNCEVCEMEENGSLFDDRLYNSGNYYLLSEREQAEEDAKAVKAIFEKRLKI